MRVEIESLLLLKLLHYLENAPTEDVAKLLTLFETDRFSEIMRHPATKPQPPKPPREEVIARIKAHEGIAKDFDWEPTEEDQMYVQSA